MARLLLFWTPLASLSLLFVLPVMAAEPWQRHCLDDSFRGADGVRLGDFNGDGLPDVTTGWEESGLVRLYVNPGPDQADRPWPAVTIAKAASPEDAVPIDVDGDGRLDVVSCHEGGRRQVLVHWNNTKYTRHKTELLDRNRWSTAAFDALDGQRWMFAMPLGKIDGRTAIVVASKDAKASITLLLSPSDAQAATARDLSAWQVIRLRDAGWVMSLRAVDMDRDGRLDIVFSDRKGSQSRAGWLKQPAELSQLNLTTSVWTEFPIAGQGREVMFLTANRQRCLIALRGGASLDATATELGEDWRVHSITHPSGIVNGKAIEAFPDGRVVMTFNTAAGQQKSAPGIWIRDAVTAGQPASWSVIDPTAAVKFDRMELVDLNGDGKLDVMTCEERQNLGVVWYQQP
ncbi:MAG: hypothetical protein CBB71_01255 [Rhodopirellula sp. TMED11]|nr:MAG: hypothetical protein CBB71_01255 [Rhodopirellula sp. TMED11]